MLNLFVAVDWAVVVSGAVAFLAYLNTLQAGFVYDDNRAILSNEDAQPGAPLAPLWLHDFWGTPLSHDGSHGSYRPLAVLSFRLNARLAGGSSSAGFHLANALLHGAATAALAAWARRLPAMSSSSAWPTGLSFALHPVHTEAVAGLVGRADVGSALFCVAALLAYRAHLRRRDAGRSGAAAAYLALTIASCVASTLTKENGVGTPLLCVAYEALCHSRLSPARAACLFVGRRSKGMSKVAARSSRCLLLSLCAMVAARAALVGGRLPTFSAADNPASRSEHLLTRALTFLYLPVFNFLLLVCPASLSFDWSMEAIPLITGPLDVRNACSAAFYCALICVVRKHLQCLGDARTAAGPCKNAVDINANVRVQPAPAGTCNMPVTPAPRRHRRCSCEDGKKTRETWVQRSSTALFGIAMVVVPFLPATNLLVYVGFVVAERVLYMPSMGYCLLVGEGLSRLAAHPRRSVRSLVFAGFLVLLLSFGGKTWRRNLDWKDEESLYRSGIHINPPKAYGNLGNVLSVQGRDVEAEDCYRKALSYRPNMADVHYNLGVLLQNQQRFPEAIHEYRVAIRCRPSLAVAHLNLGVTLGRVGRLAEAQAVLRTCSVLDGARLKDPRSHQAAVTGCLFHLGRLALDQDCPDDAVGVFMQAARALPPRYAPQSLFNMLGEAYSRLGDDAQAESWFRASLAAFPDHVAAHLTYGKLLARNTSRLTEAESWYARAQSLAPGDPAVHRHYGQFLLNQGRHQEAAQKFLLIVASSSAEYEDVIRAATSLRLAGDLQGAEKYYKMAAGIRPWDPSALSNLGALYHLTGRLQDAEELYRGALRLLPGDEVTRENLRKLARLRRQQRLSGHEAS